MAANTNTGPENLQFSSSIAGDVWRPSENRASHYCWYFDAISDDGRDSIAITFLDNFIFSPRYNSAHRKFSAKVERFPAVAFFYYRNGKPLYASVCEYGEKTFSSDGDIPSCRIGENSFHFESAPYGEGYLLNIDFLLKNGRRVKASLEWLMVEGNLLPGEKEQNSFSWNVVAPRCDVTGKIEIYHRAGNIKETIQFRGTGYHDRRSGPSWLPGTVESWQWGRAHFADVTAIFCNYREFGSGKTTTKLMLTSVDKLDDKTAYFEEKIPSRNIFGMRYPQRLTFYAKDNIRLRLKQTQAIDSSFFYLRFLSEAVLTVGDGKPRKTIAITEFLTPRALRRGWMDWMIDMRIRRMS